MHSAGTARVQCKVFIMSSAGIQDKRCFVKLLLEFFMKKMLS